MPLGHDYVIRLEKVQQGRRLCGYQHLAFQRALIDEDPNPYRYNRQYYDTESGYIYLRARYYDPAIGRFVSEDPALDGYNWYVYCGSNPIRYVDPTGLWGMDVHQVATTIWALGVGFSLRQASIIGAVNIW